jgi:hypothetical protein
MSTLDVQLHSASVIDPGGQSSDLYFVRMVAMLTRN